MDEDSLEQQQTSFETREGVSQFNELKLHLHECIIVKQLYVKLCKDLQLQIRV